MCKLFKLSWLENTNNRKWIRWMKEEIFTDDKRVVNILEMKCCLLSLLWGLSEIGWNQDLASEMTVGKVTQICVYRSWVTIGLVIKIQLTVLTIMLDIFLPNSRIQCWNHFLWINCLIRNFQLLLPRWSNLLSLTCATLVVTMSQVQRMVEGNQPRTCWSSATCMKICTGKQLWGKLVKITVTFFNSAFIFLFPARV